MPLNLHRRTILRATGVAMAIPLFDALGVGRTRAAAKRVEVVPRRIVCINTPLGLHPAFFFPKKSGPGLSRCRPILNSSEISATTSL